MKILTTVNHLCLTALLAVLLFSCNEDQVAPSNQPNSPTDDTMTKKPGGFAISRLVDVPNGRLAASKVSPQTTFDLGDVKASREFLFLLSNSGDIPVFDVNITIDHPQFTISPQRIDTLSINSANNLLSLVTVGVKHGVALNGIGEVALLEQGVHTGVVRIEGKTLVSGDTVAVTAEVDMKIEAKVADIDLYVGGTLIDLNQFDFRSIGLKQSNGYYVPKNSEVKIVNTGNVDILLAYATQRYTDGADDVIIASDEITLPSGESQVFNTLSGDRTEITIDGQNTIMKHGKILQEADGRGYITLAPPR